MTRSERVYRALLRAYPRSTREACGEDMVQLFADRLRDAASPLAMARVWAEAIADVAMTAPREHVTQRRAVKVAEGPVLAGHRPLAPDLLVAASPLLLVAILALARPGYYEPLFDDRAGLFGLPFGIAALDLAAIVAMVGIFLARRNADLADPWVQVLLLALVLVPVPVIALVEGPRTAAALAMAMTLFVLATRFRVLMLALAVPFAGVAAGRPRDRRRSHQARRIGVRHPFLRIHPNRA